MAGVSIEDPRIRALLGFPTSPEAKADLEEDNAIETDLSISEVEEMRAEISRLKEDIDNLRYTLKLFQTDIKELREAAKKRLSEPSEKDKDLIDKLFPLMRERKAQELSLVQAAFLLKVSKSKMHQLKKFIAKDTRFELGWSKAEGTRGQKGTIIRIHRFIK